MGSASWRVAPGLVAVAVVLAGVAGCSGGHQAAASKAKAASVGGITAAMLKGALLTKVNGVGPAAPASSGNYASVAQASAGKAQASAGKAQASAGKKPAGVQVVPKACAGAATEGFNPAALAGSPAAAVTFRVASNGVSEVLIASSDKSAATALGAHVPAQCMRYQEKAGGKTFTYGVKEQPVTGVGAQAKVLNVHAVGTASDDLWSLIYRGHGFVGTVTVIGPNASEKAVKELGQQAYAYATKTLS